MCPCLTPTPSLYYLLFPVRYVRSVNLILLLPIFAITIYHSLSLFVIIVTRSVQPEPSAVAIVCQNGRSSASCRASVTVTPVSRQIWWVQVVDGRPQARLHSCERRSPSLDLVQICRIWFAGTSRRSLATCPTVFACERRMRRRTGRYDAGLHRWTRSRASWCAGCVVLTVHGKNPVYSSRLVWGSRSQSHRVVWVTRTWSIGKPFTPDLKLICFTNPLHHSLRGSIWTASTDFRLGWLDRTYWALMVQSSPYVYLHQRKSFSAFNEISEHKCFLLLILWTLTLNEHLWTLTSWRPLLPYEYSCKASWGRLG